MELSKISAVVFNPHGGDRRIVEYLHVSPDNLEDIIDYIKWKYGTYSVKDLKVERMQDED